VAGRLAADRRRRARRGPAPDRAGQDLAALRYASWWQRKWRGETPTETLPEASGRVTDPELTLDVRRALAQLSRQQRAVVVLRYFEDLTEAETAVELGCSVGSVKTHHSRALARLRASGLLERIGSRT
jgi:RNA polymerase sigma factor (sigma-70 family)